MFCTRCGIQVPVGAKFCPACGAGQEAGVAPVAKPASNLSLKLAAAGGLVVILAAAGYGIYRPGPAEREAANPVKETKQAPVPAPAPAPAPVAQVENPPQKAAEPPAPAGGGERDDSASAPAPAEIAAAHEALDKKIAEEENAAKKKTAKR
ncbi:MAG: zinc-ribbon domain-containing protein [Burkholderiales bacterium]